MLVSEPGKHNTVPTQRGFRVDREGRGIQTPGLCNTGGWMRQIVSLISLAVLPFMPLLIAWRAWEKRDQQVDGVRKLLFVLGVLITSLALLVYLAFSIETFRRHDWFSDLSGFTIWLRVGLWTSVAGLVFSCFGKGKSRAWSVIAASPLSALWLIMAWAPA